MSVAVTARTADAPTSRVTASVRGTVSTITAKLLFAATVVPILALARLEWPSDDDFIYWNMAREVSLPFGFATRMYQEWSGRFLTHVLNGWFFSRPEVFPILAFVPALAFVLLPLTLLACLEGFGVVVGSRQRWLVTAVGLAALFLGLWPYLGDCVFWLTGGLVYAVPLLLAVLWLIAFLRRSTIAVAFAAPIALFNEQTAVALLVGGCFWLVLRRHARRSQVIALALLALGCVILFAAPGNAARAAAGPHGLSLSPVTVLGNYVTLIATAWPRFIGPVAVGFALGLAGRRAWPNATLDRAHVARFALVMFAGAIGATLPLAAVPDFAAPRTAFVPGAFLLVATAGFAFLLIPGSSRRAGLALATCLIATYLGLATLDWTRALALQPQLSSRWATLQSQAGSGSSVVLPPLNGERPLAIYFPDLSSDPTAWPNAAVARFYGLRTVKTAAR